MLNDLLKSMEEQYEYTPQEVEVVQNIESQSDNNLYIEEHIPYDDKTLGKLREIIEKDENSINRTTALKVMDNYELAKYKVATTVNKDELIILKQQLTLLSFQLQDIAARYNADKTIEKMYDSREDLIRLRTKRKAANKE